MDDVPFDRSIRAGLIAGVVGIYLALVGLVERFADVHLVGEPLTVARLLIVAPPFLAGYVALAPRLRAGRFESAPPAAAAVGGALAGAAAGGVLAAAIVFADAFGVDRIREVFIAATTSLLELLTFERGLAVGIGLLILLSAGFGAVGGLVRHVDARVRRPVTVGVATVLLMGLLQRIVPVAMGELDLETAWLYDPVTGGLTWLGGALVFVIAAAAAVGWRFRDRVTALRSETAAEERSMRLVVLVIVVVVLIAAPQVLGSFVSVTLGQVAVFVLLGLGLNIVVGYAGLLDLGYVAFFAFGAYSLALLTGATLNTTTGAAAPAASLHLNFYVAIWIVALLAAGVGVLIGAPVLRLRGDYLAIVTLGLGEIVSTLSRSNWLKDVVGGPQGMRDITDAAIGSYSFGQEPQHFYYLAVAFVALAVFVSWRLSRSRVGRAWNAMREDEQVADAMGISTVRYKLLAFAMGGAIGSLGGALFAVNIGSLTPASFEILVSIQVLAVVVMGGMGSLPGVIVGALVLVGLPGLLREFEEYRLLVYGAVLVGIMILRPQGLIPNVRRMRELHEEDVEQDQWAKARTEEPAITVGAHEETAS